MMTEKLLQFIWRFQYFNRGELKSLSGEPIEIVSPDKLNTNQGPDFIDARIRIGSTLFAGSVELHLKSSQWDLHGHHHDVNYRNVILHVVMENDLPQETDLPVLELKSRIASVLLSRYEALMQAEGFIPCQNSIASVKPLVWISWKERLLAERLTHKSEGVLELLKENHFHWEETFWWMLARNFGVKINSEAFLAMARSLPVTTLARHKSSIHQLESLLLGQAGLLNRDFDDSYARMLQKEYQFLAQKYNLRPITLPVHFLRMRPGNFPTIRLAQLAMLIYQSSNLFSQVLEAGELQDVRNMFRIIANDYWHYRYIPDHPSAFKKKNLGADMVENIIINTIVPSLFCYGWYHREEKYQSKALNWLEQLNPESNHITAKFKKLGLELCSAYDSQALLELKHAYCDQRKCLNCSIGNYLLKREKQD